MAKCKKCGRDAMRDSDFCFYHDENVSDEEKFAARSKGGQHSRKGVPHSLRSEDCLPIRNSDDLVTFYNLLLKEAIETEDDAGRMIRLTVMIAPKLNDAISLQALENLSNRLELIEARESGKMIDGGQKLLSGGNGEH